MWRLHKVFILFIIPWETSYSFKNILCPKNSGKFKKCLRDKWVTWTKHFSNYCLAHSTWIYHEYSWKCCFFFNWPLEFPNVLLFSISLETPCPQNPLSSAWIFSGIVHCCWYVLSSHHEQVTTALLSSFQEGYRYKQTLTLI